MRVEEGEWFSVELKDAMGRSRISSYGTACNALAQLKHAGLVATSRNSESRYTREGWVNANTTNCYLIAGTCKTVRGIHHLRFPRRAWAEYVASCRWSTRRALVRVAAWRYEIERAQWEAEWTRELTLGRCEVSREDTKHLGRQVVGSVYTNNSKNKEALKREARSAHPLTKAEVEMQELITWALDDLDESSRPVGIGSGPPLVNKPGRAQQMIPDPAQKQKQTILWVSSELVPESKARLVVDGFRDAVKLIYGVQWWHYSQGDIRKAKHYAKLVACGEAMSDHSVPAEHFAIWRLSWFKKNVKAFATKAPPIWLVMNAKWVSEKAGWFHKDYELPYSTFQPDPLRTEQLLRNEESMLRHRNHPDPWLALPRPYVEKRLGEIECGFESPFDLWPTRRR
jgi:hypothetical protein